MNKFLLVILASGLTLACSGDSKETTTPGSAATNAVSEVEVVSEADAAAEADAAMSTSEGVNAELDKMAADLER